MCMDCAMQDDQMDALHLEECKVRNCRQCAVIQEGPLWVDVALES